jgi:hypothetical protein
VGGGLLALSLLFLHLSQGGPIETREAIQAIDRYALGYRAVGRLCLDSTHPYADASPPADSYIHEHGHAGSVDGDPYSYGLSLLHTAPLRL